MVYVYYPKFNFVYSWLNKSNSLFLMFLIFYDISTFRIVKYFSYYSIRGISRFHLYVCYVFKSWQYTELYHYFIIIQRSKGRENNFIWVNHIQWEVWSAKGQQAKFLMCVEDSIGSQSICSYDSTGPHSILLDNTMLNWIEYYIRFTWVCAAKKRNDHLYDK